MVGAGPAGSYRSPSPAGLAIGRDGASCALRCAALPAAGARLQPARRGSARLNWSGGTGPVGAARRLATQARDHERLQGSQQRPGRLGRRVGRSLIRLHSDLRPSTLPADPRATPRTQEGNGGVGEGRWQRPDWLSCRRRYPPLSSAPPLPRLRLSPSSGCCFDLQ